MYDIEEKIKLRKKLKEKMSEERPLSLTVFGEEGKKNAEMEVKDDGTLILYVDGNEVGEISEDAFIYFASAYIDRCIEEHEEEEDEDSEDSEEGGAEEEKAKDKMKELAGMMMNKAIK